MRQVLILLFLVIACFGSVSLRGSQPRQEEEYLPNMSINQELQDFAFMQMHYETPPMHDTPPMQAYGMYDQFVIENMMGNGIVMMNYVMEESPFRPSLII